MVREVTTTEQTDRAVQQWAAAWALLPLRWRIRIIQFCLRADAQVADVALAVKI
jgi:hypothetical protein